MKYVLRFFSYLICSIIALIGIGSALILILLYFFAADLPDHAFLQKYSPDVSSRVFLQDGTKLCEYANEKRYFIPVKRIPSRLINAFISAEDKHFFEHQGIDFYSIARSVLKNIENIGSGKRPQGASTITQQVARIFLIKNNEISYIRKLKEAILSFRIESSLTKQQILELYLNQLYMGCGAYGVATAAKVYFNKTVDELTIAESAYLASLAKGANNYHPIKNKHRAIERRNWVILRQLQDKCFSEEEARQAMNEDIVMTQEVFVDKLEYCAEEIRKILLEKLPSESLNKSGLLIRATIDPKFQKIAYNVLRRGLENIDRKFPWRGSIASIDISRSKDEIIKDLKCIHAKNNDMYFPVAAIIAKKSHSAVALTEHGEKSNIDSKDIEWAQSLKKGDVIFVEKQNDGTVAIKQSPEVQGAIVVIDNETGKILAMQGGYSFFHSEFNRATQAMRQMGSIFKPFVYLAGLECGLAPNSIIDASPLEIDLGNGQAVWKPKNYKNIILDKITMRRALERSVNTATIRIAQEAGMKKISKLSDAFGICENMPEYFSHAIGAGETTLVKITAAFAMLANGGKKITPTLIDYVQDRNGKTVYASDNRCVDSFIGYDAEYPPKLNDNREQLVDPKSVYQLISMLEGVMERGSGASARSLKFTIAGKTGTSNDSKDVWFIGSTHDISVGVFIGYDDHSRTLGKDSTGTSTALPIFIEFMRDAKRYLTNKPFRVPKGITLRKIDRETGADPLDGSNVIFEGFKNDQENKKNDIFKQNKKSHNIAELIDNAQPGVSREIAPILDVY